MSEMEWLYYVLVYLLLGLAGTGISDENGKTVYETADDSFIGFLMCVLIIVFWMPVLAFAILAFLWEGITDTEGFQHDNSSTIKIEHSDGQGD